MRLLASGVDTLNLAVWGVVREGALELLGDVQERARVNEEAQVFSFPVTDRRFECRAYGQRGYTYWASSPDFELVVGRSAVGKFPPVLVQVHSACLHGVGVDQAVDEVERLCRLDLFAGGFEAGVSRIDLHADFQGFDLSTADLDRFVGYGRYRQAFEESRRVMQMGSRWTGMQFGRDAVVARLYDKSAEIAKNGTNSWWLDLWASTEDYDAESPAVRVEFQMRREALRDFQTKTADEVLASTQDYWRYLTQWLTLRIPIAGNGRRRRWPLDPRWVEVQGVQLASTMTGVVRRRIEDATELRLVQGIQGYATSLAAVRGHRNHEDAMADIGRLVDAYLAAKGLRFDAEVRRKLDRRLQVSLPGRI